MTTNSDIGTLVVKMYNGKGYIVRKRFYSKELYAAGLTSYVIESMEKEYNATAMQWWMEDGISLTITINCCYN